MVSKEICKKIHKIVQLALEISTTTETDVFVDCAPRADWLEVQIYEYGRKESIKDSKSYCCSTDYPNGLSIGTNRLYASFDEVVAELERIKVGGTQ